MSLADRAVGLKLRQHLRAAIAGTIVALIAISSVVCAQIHSSLAHNQSGGSAIGLSGIMFPLLLIGMGGAVFALWACWTLRKNLSSSTSELKKIVVILSDGLEQILRFVADSAIGTTHTASAVRQTTSTVEKLKETSRLSSDTAKGVFETAGRAEEISNSGRSATQDTVEGMRNIRNEMDQIAQSMARLNTKAADIAEIIATVDDIAKQSNLLAVNAAIEAAKAGEHGKGFSIVAQEVKNMAAQSKTATAQVRAILSEIQSAARAAAATTELGSHAVDAAVNRSTQARDSINHLGQTVSESATAAGQIALASDQQMCDAIEVVTAMESIREAASHNESMIQRAQEAGKGLVSLGQRLTDLLSEY